MLFFSLKFTKSEYSVTFWMVKHVFGFSSYAHFAINRYDYNDSPLFYYTQTRFLIYTVKPWTKTHAFRGLTSTINSCLLISESRFSIVKNIRLIWTILEYVESLFRFKIIVVTTYSHSICYFPNLKLPPNRLWEKVPTLEMLHLRKIPMPLW